MPNLTNLSAYALVDPLTHTLHPALWLVVLLLLPMSPVPRSRLLNRVVMGLQRRQVHRIRIHQFLRHRHNVTDETLEEVCGHAFADDHAQDFNTLLLGRERVICGGGVVSRN